MRFQRHKKIGLPGSENTDHKSSVMFVQESVRVAAIAQKVDQPLEGNRIEFANYHLKNSYILAKDNQR